jgi:hypothetical protein
VPLVRFPELSTDSRFLTFLTRFRRRRGTQEPNSLTREVNYDLRLTICAACSFVGLMLLAYFENIGIRVLGIMLAALSSNLGDM